jgi:hypothetical protein
MNNARAWPAPWVFSLLILPLGMIVGFNFTPLPLLLANAGVPVDRIPGVNSIVNLPGVLGLLVAPVVDIKLRRRAWWRSEPHAGLIGRHQGDVPWDWS